MKNLLIPIIVLPNNEWQFYDPEEVSDLPYYADWHITRLSLDELKNIAHLHYYHSTEETMNHLNDSQLMNVLSKLDI